MKSTSKSQQSTSTINQDQRVAIGGNGTAVSVPGTLSVGGNLNLTDGNAVSAALNTVQNVVGGTVDAIGSLAAGSNEIASQVAASQKEFVGQASGQKTYLWAAAILAAVLILKK